MNTTADRPSRSRKWLYLSLAVVVIVAVLIAAAPALVSGPGRGLVLDRVNAALEGRIELDGLKIGWRGPQEVRGLRVYDPGGDKVLEIGSVEIDGSLLGLATSPHCRGEILVRDVTGEIVVEADGRTNLEKVTGPGEAAAAAGPPSFERLRGMDCQVRLENTELALRAAGMDPIRVSGLAATARLNGLETLDIQADAVLIQGETRGRLELQASASGLFDAQARPDLAGAEFDFNFDLKDFPVDMADRLAGLDGRLRAVLGPVLNQQLEGEWRGGGGRLALDMSSSRDARAQLQLTIRDGAISLENPGEVAFSIGPEAWSVLVPDGASLLAPFQVDARLEALAFDPEASVAALDARLTISDIELQTDDPQVGRLALRQARLGMKSADLREGLTVELDTLAAQGDHSGRARLQARLSEFLTADLQPATDSLRVEVDGTLAELPLAVLDQVAGVDGLASAALGPRMNAAFSATSVPAEGSGNFSMNMASAHLNAEVNGQMYADALRLDTGRAQLQIQPALAGRLFEALELSAPAGLDVQVQRLRVPRAEGALDPQRAEFEGSAVLAETSARLGPDGHTLQLAGTLKASSERFADGLALAFDGRVGDRHGSGRASAAARLDGALALAEPAQVTLTNFPTAVADRFLGADSGLVRLIGESLTLQLGLSPQDSGQLAIDADLEAPLLKTRATASYGVAGLSLEPDSSIEWTLTPEAFAAFQAEPEWSLLEPAYTDVRFDRLQIALDGAAIDLRSLEVAAEARMPTLAIRRGDDPALRFSGMNVTAAGRPLGERLQIRAGADLAGGRFDSESTLEGLVNAAGELDPASARLQTETHFDEVPSSVVLAVAQLDPALGAALGPSVSARASGRLPGSLTIDAQGTNTRVSIDSRIDRDGVLGLNRDAEMQLNITPELIDGYLARLHPFLSDVRSAEQPIRLLLSAEGFRLPLTEYQPNAIRASGRLEIGTLDMNRGAITSGLFAALQQLGGNVAMGSNFQARFTPLEFTVHNGRVETNDLWMQMNNMMLGALATIRLPEQADAMPWAEMVFAVPGQTLRGLPRLGGSIAPDRILTTTTSGPLDQIKPEFSGMFAGLVGQSAIDRLAGDSEAGQVIGGLLRGISGGRRQGPSTENQAQTQSEDGSRARWPNMPPIEPATAPGDPQLP